MNDTKTAAAYIRVSTDNQTELSPDSQIKVIRRYAAQHGYIIPDEYIYRDDGISGRHADKRPAFNRMIAASKQKPSPFSAVLLWKFSRFARNQEESIFYKSMLRKNNIDVVSVSEPVTDGPFGALIERIIEWSDEYYSIRLSDEVRRGMAERVERGGAVSIPAFGYNIENKQYIIDPETAPIVRKIFSDCIGGVPINAIARRLNELGIKTARGNPWEHRSVEYILRNPVYIGKIRWNPKRRTGRGFDDPDIIIAEGAHEPIISEEVFDAARKLIAENKRKHQKYVSSVISSEYMLHGLVRCSSCGRTLSMAAKGAAIQCVGYIHGKCGVSHHITLKKINEAVISAIDETFGTGQFLLTVRCPAAEAVHNEEPDFKKLTEKERMKLRRIREAYEEGVYTLNEYKESRDAINEHIEQLSRRLQAAPDSEKLHAELTDRHKSISTILRDPAVSEEDKNILLREFIDKIIFSRADASIKLYFRV